MPAGTLNPTPLYTHHFPLAQLGDALNATRDRPEGFMKALIDLDENLLTADPIGGVWTYALDLARASGTRQVEVVLATMGAALRAEQRAEAEQLPNVELHESEFALEWMDESVAGRRPRRRMAAATCAETPARPDPSERLRARDAAVAGAGAGGGAFLRALLVARGERNGRA